MRPGDCWTWAGPSGWPDGTGGGAAAGRTLLDSRGEPVPAESKPTGTGCVAAGSTRTGPQVVDGGERHIGEGRSPRAEEARGRGLLRGMRLVATYIRSIPSVPGVGRGARCSPCRRSSHVTLVGHGKVLRASSLGGVLRGLARVISDRAATAGPASWSGASTAAWRGTGHGIPPNPVPTGRASLSTTGRRHGRDTAHMRRPSAAVTCSDGACAPRDRPALSHGHVAARGPGLGVGCYLPVLASERLFANRMQ